MSFWQPGPHWYSSRLWHETTDESLYSFRMSREFGAFHGLVVGNWQWSNSDAAQGTLRPTCYNRPNYPLVGINCNPVEGIESSRALWSKGPAFSHAQLPTFPWPPTGGTGGPLQPVTFHTAGRPHHLGEERREGGNDFDGQAPDLATTRGNWGRLRRLWHRHPMSWEVIVGKGLGRVTWDNSNDI